MKRIIRVILSMILTVIIITISLSQDSAALKDNFSSADDQVKIITREINYKDEDISINLKIPIISGLKNKTTQNIINGAIVKKVIDFKDSIKLQAKQDKTKMHPYEVVSTYFVSLNKNNILSLTLELYAYTAGAHGMTYRVPYNIDLENGKQLELKDLFKEGVNYKDIINKEIEKKIQASEDWMFFEGAFKGISDDQPFFIKDGSIVIYFPLYEIAPYAVGFPEFEIPFELFSGGIKI